MKNKTNKLTKYKIIKPKNKIIQKMNKKKIKKEKNLILQKIHKILLWK